MTEEPADKPLTILIACDTYPPHLNGAAQFGFRLAQGMHGRGHNVHVLAPSPGERTQPLRDRRSMGRAPAPFPRSAHPRVLADLPAVGNQEAHLHAAG